jgi:hypothetical protein
MMRQELETLGALRRELGRALQAFSAPLSTTMQLFADAKADCTPERWAEVADACEATLRELGHVTCAIETLHEALLRKSRGDRPTLPGREAQPPRPSS